MVWTFVQTYPTSHKKSGLCIIAKQNCSLQVLALHVSTVLERLITTIGT